MNLEIGPAIIRPWRWEDAESLARHANNRAIWRNLRDTFPNPYTLDDAWDWIGRNIDAPVLTNFAIVVDGEAVGGIGIIPGIGELRRSAEIGYWLAQPYWGRGIATEAVRAVTGWAFENFDLVRLHATVFEWNPASARVLEKAGYRFEGRLRKSITKEGRTIDSLLYARIRDDVEGG